MTKNTYNIRRRSLWATCKAVFCSLCVLTTFLTSCSDFLQIEPKEIIVLDKYWDEEADVEGVVAGCYSSMQSQSVISRMMVWGEFRSDNIVGGRNYENDIQIANIFKENINASNTYAKWGDFYNVINRCNIVLRYAPEVAQKDPSYTQSKLNATIAEVSALRDLMYFYLIRSFCDVPYITEPYLDDNQQMDIPASTFDDVLTSLIEDLESKQSMAVKRYPLTQTYYQRGRITQDAIHALLADLYLWKQDYANVVRYADMVINAKLDEYETEKNKRISSANDGNELIDGYPLISDAYTTGNYYGTAFEGIFGSGNSSESIFELIFMNDDDMLANGAVSSLYGNATTFPGLARPADFIGTDVSDESFNIFLSKYDARFYENLQPVQGQSNTYGINKYVTPSAMVDLSKAEIQSTYSSPYADGKCHSNWIIYRLTDVMLMKAEALVEMAPEGEDDYSKQQADTLLRQAFSIVNAINKRSNCSKEDKNMDGNTSYLVGTVSRKGTSGSGALSSKLSRMEAIYWPYHIDELKVNGNLKQNPAFGSGEDSSIVPH